MNKFWFSQVITLLVHRMRQSLSPSLRRLQALAATTRRNSHAPRCSQRRPTCSLTCAHTTRTHAHTSTRSVSSRSAPLRLVSSVALRCSMHEQHIHTHIQYLLQPRNIDVVTRVEPRTRWLLVSYAHSSTHNTNTCLTCVHITHC
jgi:hypothetical protein